MSDLRIGRLAALAGVTVDTIRFYERRGLLPRARRDRSGYRVFDASIVERLTIIRSLVEMQLGLDEIRAMLAALSADAECSDERPRLAAALDRTEAKLAELSSVRDRLRAALTRCDGGSCELASRARRVGASRLSDARGR